MIKPKRKQCYLVGATLSNFVTLVKQRQTQDHNNQSESAVLKEMVRFYFEKNPVKEGK